MKFFDISKFKDKHKGETFVLFGSGPSLMHWDNKFCENAIKVGCNSVFMHKADLDYYFIQDSGIGSKSKFCYLNNKKIYDEYMPKLAKFYGISLRNKKPYFLNDIKSFFDILYFFTPKKSDRFLSSIETFFCSLLTTFLTAFLITFEISLSRFLTPDSLV